MKLFVATGLSLLFASMMTVHATDSPMHLRTSTTTEVVEEMDASLDWRKKKKKPDRLDEAILELELNIESVPRRFDQELLQENDHQLQMDNDEVINSAIRYAFSKAFGNRYKQRLGFVDRQWKPQFFGENNDDKELEQAWIGYTMMYYILGDGQCRWCPPDDDSMEGSDMTLADLIAAKVQFAKYLLEYLQNSGSYYYDGAFRVAVGYGVGFDAAFLAVEEEDDNEFLEKRHSGPTSTTGSQFAQVELVHAPLARVGISDLKPLAESYVSAYNAIHANSPFRLISFALLSGAAMEQVSSSSTHGTVRYQIETTWSCSDPTGTDLCAHPLPLLDAVQDPGRATLHKMFEAYFCWRLNNLYNNNDKEDTDGMGAGMCTVDFFDEHVNDQGLVGGGGGFQREPIGIVYF